ncbi:IS1/IS6 family transposase [Candidatus Pacearchaeota archaeon]|nr:IS1/IS6 family transposase [Candidatus Pacearchaeota archaeon]
MENAIKCKHCSSLNFCKKGFRITEHRGKIQKYYCKDCHKFFTNDDGFYRMRNKPEIITMSIDMYISNLSSRKMRNQLSRHLNTKVSHMSILDWVRRYTLKVSKFVDKLRYNMGNSFYADETLIDCEGRDDRFWCCLDWDTRLITGVHYSLSGNPIEAQKFLFKFIQKGKPKFIQTDGGVFYPKAFRKLFYSNKIGGLIVEHKIQNASVTKIHNYRIETVFMKIKDRANDFRGLKALWSAPILMNALIIQHNFIEAHTTLDEVPCNRAGQELDLGENRWLGLIKLSTTS